MHGPTYIKSLLGNLSMDNNELMLKLEKVFGNENSFLICRLVTCRRNSDTQQTGKKNVLQPVKVAGFGLYSGVDKSLARPGRKQVNISVRMA